MRKEILFTAIVCLLLGTWLSDAARHEWQAQAVEPAKAAAPAIEPAKAAPAAPATNPQVVPDDVVLKAENWHRAIFNHAEYVVYTGPGTAMWHHWVVPAKVTPKPVAKPEPAKTNSK